MRSVFFVLLALCLAGCAGSQVTPLSTVPVATAYKEAQGNWIAAAPADTLQRGAWWQLYEDAELDHLQQKLLANSPDLASALARYQQAQAATDAVRSLQSPTLGGLLNVERDRQSERRPLRVLGPQSPDEYTNASLGLSLQYELDLWGRVRQQVNAGIAQEQAAQADLAGARLSLQAQLADMMIALRGVDQEVSLLRETENAYARAAEMIAHRHQIGIASGLDLARAQTQLETTRSQLQQVQARRAVLEHAIAALTGANASTFSLTPKSVPEVIPAIPFGLPSALLQRRPDIAAAQRRVAAANASVGVARSAFFPSITFNALGGFQSNDLSQFVAAPNIFWAIGPNLLVNLIDGGRRKAEVRRSEAVLEEVGQNYRSVVLVAFQQVEDQLALLNHYGQAAAAERQAVASSQQALNLATNRYREGAVSYLEVVTAQTASLQARRSVLDLTTRQRRATVQLIRALGGGWSTELIEGAAQN